MFLRQNQSFVDRTASKILVMICKSQNRSKFWGKRFWKQFWGYRSAIARNRKISSTSYIAMQYASYHKQIVNQTEQRS